HPRINILNPGPGVGGHCISVDPWFFVEAAPEVSALIYQARKVNDEQPHFVVNKAQQAFGELRNKRIAALGLAYKPDVDDLRESPAVEVVRLLQKDGAIVRAWEPFAPSAKLEGIDMAVDFDSAIKDVDAILLLVNHSQFRSLDPASVASKTKARIAIDAVNAWNLKDWQAAGFSLHRLGDAKSK
ncbi:MAG TPA: UDP binding domain-containing protein, partial [Anaerolineales bacterium]|nr:UDP binding domain-containing protein [Anaerolineales bacterium]